MFELSDVYLILRTLFLEVLNVRFILLLFALACSDNSMVHTIIEKQGEYPDIEDMAVTIEEDVTIIEDTAPDYEPIWVDHFYQPSQTDGVDIIWVIDPSGSMNNHQARLMQGIAAMMGALPSADWRLAIIPADHRFSKDEDQFPLVPGDTALDAENMYLASKKGAFEAGFDALYAYIMENDYSLTWMRHDAALLVVFVSDEEEQSNVYFSQVNQFLSWITSYRNNVYLASIVNLDPSDSECTNNSSFTGTRYINATNYFGGQVIDICSEDWTAGVQDASTQIEPYEYWDLTHVPLDQNFIYVFVDGVIYTDWYFDSTRNRIYFDILPPGNSLVEITYNY